ncbi:hypothetical protein ABT354_30890 [Streptomyces sp. NPDC000594]|uniref:hypothetical protein n=1 Tax=Streptomyces sp. NPDC000594 TaxID=3154261 RepID=UPI0033220AB3
MRPPTELDRVPWDDLTHAYGPAGDVPELIRALYQGDEDATGEAIDELFGTIHHQGTVYRASAPAVPFVAHAVHHVPDRRVELLMLLATLADHDPEDAESPHWPTSPVAAVCAELCRVLPELLPCLRDPERAVRRAALRVVAAVADLLSAEFRTTAVSQIEPLYATDPVPAVRADALVVLNWFGRLLEPLESPLPEVRVAAALYRTGRSLTGPNRSRIRQASSSRYSLRLLGSMETAASLLPPQKCDPPCGPGITERPVRPRVREKAYGPGGVEYGVSLRSARIPRRRCPGPRRRRPRAGR